MSLLSQKINKHLEKDFVAFHSPAHAGKLNPRDLTELDGLDDLQYPEEVLKESQELVAELFGAKKSFFLVNGASVGMQAACIALKIHLNSINDKRPVLVARNVHKSVIAGIILAGLALEWLEPEWREDLGLFAVIARSTEGATWQSSMEEKYSALIITNPTYEGFYSKIPQLNIPLIVDEAHGAHYYFSKQLPEPALAYGADIVVQSWHKTLGSLTQTGVLHVGRASKIPENFIQDALRLLQTTSPSYLLMESITNTAELYAERGTEIVERTIKLSKSIELPGRVKNNDPYRLLIQGPGYEIENSLKENNILIEAAGANYALAFINPGNNMEDISKLNGQRSRVNGLVENHQMKSITKPSSPQTSEPSIRDAFFSGDTEIYAPCPPGIALRVPGSTPYLTKLQRQQFHKLIIGAALKDYKTIEDYAYLFTHAGADAIDISAFPHSVISASKGIKQAIEEDPSLSEPLVMVSVNIGEDPHFRRIELNWENCTECLACVPSCPSGAFSVNGQRSTVFSYNSDLCFGCSACLPTCHFDALSFVSWSAFDSQSLDELKVLGANAIEIHLNNDLDAFAEFYRKMHTEFELESFCVGSDQMAVSELQAAAQRIIEEVNLKHGLDRAFIIQCDGTPMSGARDLGSDIDMCSINNAATVLKIIQTHYPSRKNIYIQLAGGITETSLRKSKSHGVQVHGVAIGSYARKKLSEINLRVDQIKSAKEMLAASVV